MDQVEKNRIGAIQVSDLTVAYQRKPVLWEISLDIPAGSLVGLVGPNGAGKSTLIKAMMGLVPKVSGEIFLDAKTMEDRWGSLSWRTDKSVNCQEGNNNEPFWPGHLFSQPMSF